MSPCVRALGVGVCIAVTLSARADGTRSFRIGVCCHPGYVDLMPIEWGEVFDWIDGIGGDICRIDWSDNWESNDRIDSAARAAGIELLPVVFPPRPQQDTEEEWYEVSRRYARECARRYSDSIRYFELSNERDTRCMTKWPGGGDRDGAAISDYDEAEYRPIRGMLRGLADGIADQCPKCDRLIDTAGWLHFGFVDMLVRDSVPFDILAWHWYSEMSKMTETIESYSGQYVVLDELADYGRPIWITEGDIRNGTLHNSEAEQAAYLVNTIERLRDSAKIDAYVIYELFDEPYLLSSGAEAFYGIVHCEWGLSEGREFPGADGTIDVGEVAGRDALKVTWDFTGGGRYISANWLPRRAVSADELRLTVRTDAGSLPVLLRFVDSTGQHLQMVADVKATGEWQDLRFSVTGPWSDHWGGRDDGVVHQPLRGVWIGVRNAARNTGELDVASAGLYRQDQAQYEFDFSTDTVFAPKSAWQELKEAFASSRAGM